MNLSRRYTHHVFSIILAAVFTQGCGSSHYTEYARSEYRRISSLTGDSRVVVGVVPNSRGPVADAMTAGLQEGLVESSLSRSIRRTLKAGRATGDPVFVTGSSRLKNEWALESALKFAGKDELKGLKIYFDNPIREKIKTAAKHAGARIMGV